MELKLVYLASPYSHKDAAVRQKRFEDVCRIHGDLLILYGTEYTFIGPIAMSHPIAQHSNHLDTSWNYWQEHDKAIIKRCDELWIVPLDGWERSVGVKAEIAYAELVGKPMKIYRPDLSETYEFYR